MLDFNLHGQFKTENPLQMSTWKFVYEPRSQWWEVKKVLLHQYGLLQTIKSVTMVYKEYLIILVEIIHHVVMW